MSRIINPVTNTESFGDWVDVTNQLANIASQTVTVAANSGGDITSGNAFVNGIFGATSLVANTLGGGTVGTSTNLNIISNTTLNGILVVNGNTGLYGNTIRFGANSSSLIITVTTNTTSSDVTFFSNSATFNSNVFLKGSFLLLPNGNTGNRPSSPANGTVRYNNDTGLIELYTANAWNGLAVGNLIASGISFTPNGTISSNTVQAAIVEVNNEKVSLSGDTMNGALVINLNGVTLPTSITGTSFQAGQVDSSESTILIDAFGAASSVTGRRSDGGNSSRSAIVNGDELFSIRAVGHNGSDYSTISTAKISVTSLENWSQSNNGSQINFEITAIGSNVRASVLSINSNVISTNARFVSISGNTIANNATILGALVANSTLTVNGITTFNSNVITNGTSLTINNGVLIVGNSTVKSYINQAGVSSDGVNFYSYWTQNTLVNPVSYTSSGTFTKPQRTSIAPLTDGATITPDFTSSQVFSITLGGNRTLANPTGLDSAVGQGIIFFITQDGTGSRTLSFGTNYKFPFGAAPTLSTTAGATDIISGFVMSNTQIVFGSIIQAVA